MNVHGISMASLVKEMEIATGNDFQKVLKALSSSIYVDEKLLKTELGLLNAKILKLLRSNKEYDVWKGCHAVSVICSFNALFLLSYGGQSLSAVYAKLEHMSNYYSSTTNTTQGRTLLKTLVSTTKTLMDLMRNKPTLSRECLVPKLKAIIPTLIQLSRNEPELCLPILKDLLFKHSTTFKPYVNKFRASLTEQIATGYHHFPKEVQLLLCSNYAYLHLIKLQAQHVQDETEAHHRVYQDETWRAGIFSILIQFKPIVKLCNNILDFDQDKELTKLFDSLPSEPYKDYKIEDFLTPLKLDLNEPFTLWELPRRINLLTDLLVAFVTQPTPFPIRVPIGTINFICETLVSVSTKYLPIKRELRRDQDLNAIIIEILPEIQYAGITLWKDMLKAYGKCFLPMSDRILGSLEVFLPFKPKTTTVDFEACKNLEDKFLNVFEVANLVLSNVGHRLNEVDSILKLVDVGLYLTEDTSLIENIFDNKPLDKKEVISSQNKNKTKHKKDNKAGAITDLYTNYDQFLTKTSLHRFDEVNNFLSFIISNWRLGTSQQIHTIKYAISRSLQIREQMGFIPQSFVKLLRILVLNPGNEKLSILPIAISLLKTSNDVAFDLLCHPRLPMGIVHNVKRVSDAEEEDQNVIEVGTYVESKDSKIVDAPMADTFNVLEATEEEETVFVPTIENTVTPVTDIENETKIFKKRTADETVEIETEVSTKRTKVNTQPKTKEDIIEEQIIADNRVEKELQPAVERAHAETARDETIEKDDEEDEDEEDEEFEIPEIHLSEYEDDEDAESDS
ncbi:similar to Saccharomyces cerevisiae YHR197W RIX1 Essential component of the Rix1 complex (Rix1p, Ipi1p, Ipi3p) that is required for processing of ITS2 sequences from 35S pre-rRNA [Maudiozyma saulgeensis]|uniref:Pre-rRNA-processing protein RIX1 n=1 Tax=Maudiozyma saulgeensis TaxID=1789683 RepID=A0A1X7R129_9SACH|nr:similar to Saccharomyces cerevisiae YHR197W RIX1 Essential component of the Rix1 complex (Rix1p, Ipi1p, Ipi3p) that is required for processing of ITS2 sequences from 35S pre-rRNA [Kazachstania saulgeensis]